EYKVKNIEGKFFIFDVVRKKYVALTPEEWVRQHAVHYMIEQLNYPKSLITIESSLKYNQLQKRTDIVVHNREGLPWLLVECKAPTQKLDSSVSFQLAMYNRQIQASHLVMTNGLVHLSFSLDTTTGEIIRKAEFPAYP